MSGVLAALLGLMQASSNGTYLSYARASRKLVLMAGYVFRQADNHALLSLTARELRSSANRKLVKFSFLAALSVCIVWFPYVSYRGGRGSALAIPCILALITFSICFIFLNMMFSVLGDVVLSEGGVFRYDYNLSLCGFAVASSGIFGIFVLTTYRTGVADRGTGSGGDWWVDAIVFVLSVWWVVYSVLYFGFGFKVWGLCDIGLLFLQDFQDGVVRKYAYFSDAMSAISDEARCDVLAEIIPADWYLYPCGSDSRLDELFVGWRAWRRRVGLVSSSEIESNVLSVNLRTFIEDAFKVDVGAVNGGDVADLRAGKDAIDLWHYRSILKD